jgi:diguanylate cyclase (GGDEF)-like protein
MFTVGVLIDSVESYFNKRAISDLIDAAEERSLRIVFFFGGACDAGKTAGSYSYSFSLPRRENVDALIILPHSITPHNPETSAKTIADSFRGIPVYALFGNLPDYYSVWTRDNVPIEKMIRHLAKDHGYKRFAILLGPDTEESVSRTRMRIIQRELENNSIKLDPEQIFRGNFTVDSGKTVAKDILTREGDSPEVLVCLNDQMAIGAVQEFTNTGIAVPEDIAVVGFDDVEENTTLPCSLTTISFPVWDMISALMDQIASDLSGDTAYNNRSVEMQGKFMHRESCGCTSWFERANASDEALHPNDRKAHSPGTIKRAEILRRSLEDIVEECIATNNTALFTDFILQTIQTLSRSGELTNSFIDIFSTQWTVTLLRHMDFSTQTLINTLFIDAFRLLIQVRLENFAQIHSNDLGSLQFYQNCNDLLAQKLATQGAIRGIASNIPQLGIHHCLLVFIAPDDPNFGEIRLAYNKGTGTEIPREDFPRIPIHQLGTSGLRAIKHPVAILTIAYNNNVYGYMLLSIHDKHIDQFSMVQRLVSQILDSAMANDLLSSHIQNLTKKNDALSRLSVIDEFTGLYNRRALYVTGRNMFDQSVANGETSCFIFLDMDGLKKINDSFGHKDGDMAILALASVLKKSFREKDLVVRYGGDEFVVLMTNIEEKILQMALNRIEAQLDAFNKKKAYPWTLSASWGYVFNEAGGAIDSFESIIEESDARLYEKKRLRKTQ